MLAMRNKRSLFASASILIATSGLYLAGCGGSDTPISAPVPAPSPSGPSPAPSPPPPPPQNPAAVAAIDTTNRSEVLARFRQTYVDSTPRSWTGGSVRDCRAGTLSSDYRVALVRRINYFRAMAGLSGSLVENEGASTEAQAAALLMDANMALSHSPPNTWKCYSPIGVSGAARSNLCLGCADAAPLLIVDDFIWDDGDNNKSVGHRRWLLYSKLAEVGVGETTIAGAINVLAGTFAVADPKASGGVAWPNRGYIPRVLFNPTYRWSYSCPNANFGSAVVEMRDDQNRPIAVIIESRSDPVGDSSIVWRVDVTASPRGTWDPGSMSSAADTRIAVSINGVLGCGSSTVHSYTTTIFNVSN